MGDNKILDKLRKLQAFQKSAEEIGNEHEALNAAAKIADIIREYNINIEDLEYKEVERGITHEYLKVDVYKNIGGAWRERLWVALSRSCFCRVYYVKGYYHKMSGDVVLVGNQTNIEALKAMYDAISFRIVELSKQKWKERKGGEKMSKDKFQRHYLRGVVESIRERLKEEHKASEAKISSSAVVLYNSKAISKYVASVFGRVEQGCSTYRPSDAFDQGRADGKNVNINGASVGSGAKQLGAGN